MSKGEKLGLDDFADQFAAQDLTCPILKMTAAGGMACYALPDCLHATIAAAQDIDSSLENLNDWCQQETQP